MGSCHQCALSPFRDSCLGGPLFVLMLLQKRFRHGFTAVDRPDGFLVLAVASLENDIIEVKSTPENTKSLEENKMGLKGPGRKKTDESEHQTREGDIKVPCGRLIASEHTDSPLEHNEYAVYDPRQVLIRFLVGVKHKEKDAVMETEE